MAEKLYTIDGISVKLDPRIIKTYEVGELSILASQKLPDKKDPSYTDVVREVGAANIKLVSKILGKQKKSVIDAIAKKNGGYDDIDKVIEWVGKLTDEISDAKN